MCPVYKLCTWSVALVPGPSTAVCAVVSGGWRCGGAWSLRTRAGVGTVTRGKLYIWQRQIHIYRTEAHNMSTVNKTTHRATLLINNNKHELLGSCTLWLYIMPLQLHEGINITLNSEKLSKFSLTTEAPSMKWNKDMHLTDATYTVNAVHETRLESSKYIFSQLLSEGLGNRVPV